MENGDINLSEIGSKQYLCIFGGGAIRGLAYLGAMRAMKELGVKIKSFAGSSVGAVFAAFASLDYTFEEFGELFKEVNFDLFRDVRLDITKKFAISKGEHFLHWIRAGIERKFYKDAYIKGKNPPVTFKDIDKDFFVITTNINGCEPYIFSKYTTPDFEIAQAVWTSTALPGLLEPFEYDKNVLIDGDIMKSWPMWRISDILCPKDCRVIEFRLEGAKCWPDVKNSVEYLNAVFAAMSNFATEYIMETYQPKDKFDYIKIDTDHILPVQFTLPQAERDKLVELGYNTTMEYFKKTLLQKKKTLLPFYKVILDHLIKTKRDLVDGEILDAKSQICDLFIYLCDAKRYIDITIYDNAVKFKDYFFSHISESFFLHRIELKDSREVEFYLDNLYNEVLERCIELEDYIKEFG